MSPSGSTNHVGQVIVGALKNRGVDVVSLDLAKQSRLDGDLAERLRHDRSCLFIGSPVYFSRAIPPVLEFIASLPKTSGGHAVPFVTWGGASSGIALHDMGQALQERGYEVIGAGKVLAEHSMMWRFSNPLGENHPDDTDDQLVTDLVERVIDKFSAASPVPALPLEMLAYQPQPMFEEMSKIVFAKAKTNMPAKQIDEQRCTQCGLCAEECPVQAISLAPFPEFADTCICCFKCVRICPEDAFINDLTMLDSRIRERARTIDEQPKTEMFM
ncbi:MAG: 4Fe-4S binding protein [Desulfofustis sp.]|nr:4Fe-4S binding protein [Desulfofustis sp.]